MEAHDDDLFRLVSLDRAACEDILVLVLETKVDKLERVQSPLHWEPSPGVTVIMYQVVIVAVVLCILFKVLNVNNSPAKSLFYSANAKFLEQILQNAPSLNEP